MNGGLLVGILSKRPRERYYPVDDRVIWTPNTLSSGVDPVKGAGYSYAGTNAGIVNVGRSFTATANGRVLFKWANTFLGGNPTIILGLYKNGLPMNESPLTGYNWSAANVVQQEIPVKAGDVLQLTFNDNFNLITPVFTYIYMAVAGN